MKNMRLHLVTALTGGAGRSLTAAVLALGLHHRGRPTLLVQQSFGQLLVCPDPIAHLPLPVIEGPLRPLAPDASDEPGGAFRDNIGLAAADPFLTAVRDATRRPDLRSGRDGELDVVVDLTPLSAALTVDLYQAASSLLVPVRSSPFAVDGAVRTATRLSTIGVLAGAERPLIFAAIAPDGDRDGLHDDLGRVIEGYDPDAELRSAGTWGHRTNVPWLTETWLTALRDECPAWQDPTLIAACRSFADAVLTTTRLARPAEGLA